MFLEGLTVFGFDDVKSIRALLLPVFTDKQLKERLRFFTERRHAANPIKELWLLPFKPMFALELDVLKEVNIFF